MVEDLLKTLKSRGETVSFAESCTGGQLSAEFSRQAGISAIFVGSVVSYSNEVKQSLLGVSPSLLKTMGAVSDVVAAAMAKGVKHLTHSTWAVSITGIAGPDGGSVEKPVGTVWFAIVGPGIEVAEKKVFAGDRSQIQQAAVNFAIELLKHHCIKGENHGNFKK